MKKIILYCIGRLRDKNLKALEARYLKRIYLTETEIVEKKAVSASDDSSLALSREASEFQSFLKKRGGLPYLILSEHGVARNSVVFSHYLFNLLDRHKNVVFFVAGDEGSDPSLEEGALSLLSLSPLTFPHQMVRPLFWEQVYRAQTILEGHPYHK